MKDKDQYELHEKTRKRIRQKRRLYFHFVFFIVGSLFMLFLNKFVKFKPEIDWYIWAIFIWFFLLSLHFVNVFVMNRYFGKDWLRTETEKLVRKHHKKVEELEKSLEKEGAFSTKSSEENENS